MMAGSWKRFEKGEEIVKINWVSELSLVTRVD